MFRQQCSLHFTTCVALSTQSQSLCQQDAGASRQRSEPALEEAQSESNKDYCILILVAGSIC
jgi:hypothetical protein